MLTSSPGDKIKEENKVKEIEIEYKVWRSLQEYASENKISICDLFEKIILSLLGRDVNAAL